MARITSRSATLRPNDSIASLGRAGVDVISLAGSSGEFDIPDSAKAAVADLLARGSLRLTDSRGQRELREALSGAFLQEKGVELDPNGIVVTVGAKEATMATFMGLLEAGDEVLLPDPVWVGYEPWILRAGAIPIRFSMGKENNYRVNWDEVRRLLSSRTRLVVLTNPHNPTGTVFRRDEFGELAKILSGSDVLLMSDESNAGVVHEGHVHVSPLQVPDLANRTILLRSFSKTFAMSGWRVGYVWAPKAQIGAILAAHEHAVSCVSAVVQSVALAVLQSPDTSVLTARMQAAYRERRGVFIARLNMIPGVACHYPEGAFHAFPDFSAFHMPSRDLAQKLVNEEGIICIPGAAFGSRGEGHLRMAFTQPVSRLNEAATRIARLCSQLAATGSGPAAPEGTFVKRS